MIKKHRENIAKIHENFRKSSRNLRQKEIDILSDLIKKSEAGKLEEIRKSLKSK